MAREGKALSRPPASSPDGDRALPGAAEAYTYTTDLGAVRAIVQRYAHQAGLSEAQTVDLTLAVSEVAANTIRHAKSPGRLRVWFDEAEIVCQLHDEGLITDPMAGRRQPSLDAQGGHGLWIVHQVCDQVDLQSGPDGTTIALHMKRPAPAPVQDRFAPGP